MTGHRVGIRFVEGAQVATYRRVEIRRLNILGEGRIVGPHPTAGGRRPRSAAVAARATVSRVRAAVAAVPITAAALTAVPVVAVVAAPSAAGTIVRLRATRATAPAARPVLPCVHIPTIPFTSTARPHYRVAGPIREMIQAPHEACGA
ncbi:hypothetical protein GOARA_009_00010 [Gordonia araii NBRC 100433]|uniref:Uncharacterized protein n=1 Tax=Gordonia araii NBRC 100433 TaxID=1073574 RepID=G7GXM9_9ACTN|nr:hypothetical protein GOARA_009_00010 [Gordonia araii NBRC 100433]